MYKCHGAHNGEERGTRRQGCNSKLVFNSDKARQGRHTGTLGVMSRPDHTNQTDRNLNTQVITNIIKHNREIIN